MKHKHYDAIVAWANGAEIEVSTGGSEWQRAYQPRWYECQQYRIAKPKPRIETRWLWADDDGVITSKLRSEPIGRYTIKLEWSATEFEVDSV